MTSPRPPELTLACLLALVAATALILGGIGVLKVGIDSPFEVVEVIAAAVVLLAMVARIGGQLRALQAWLLACTAILMSILNHLFH